MAIIQDVVNFEGGSAGQFLKPVTENPEITKLGFELIDDVVTDKYIYLNGELDKITKLRTGCGAKTDTDLGLSITRKQLAPVTLEVFKSQCADVFDNTIFREALKRGVDTNDLSDTEILQMLLKFVDPVVSRDALRILLLADTADADADYSMMDGFYKKLADGATTDGIPDAGAIVDADLTVANIQATLQAVYDAQDRKLRQVADGEKRFYVTYSVYEAWKAWLQTNAALESAKTQLVNGLDDITFQGVPLVRLDIVDQYLSADFSTGSPAVITNPHRIVLTKPDNHVLALDTVSKYNQVKFWYSHDDDVNKFKARYMLDYQYKYPELNVIAGF
jgi:hypothetical protein